jgi:hypothetical protein
MQDGGLKAMHKRMTNYPATSASRPSLPNLDGAGWISRSRRIILLFLLVVVGFGDRLSGQTTSQKGLPVIFVHGICDRPDSFLPAESAVKTTLRNHYPALYEVPQLSGDSDEYVVFYDGINVHFQAPPFNAYNPILAAYQIEPSTRFFLVALDDPAQTMYGYFDKAEVMKIPIYSKGNELAHIIWKIKEITGAPRVIIVAHSMGGLV